MALILSSHFACFWGLSTGCQAYCPSNFTSWAVSCRPLKTEVWWFTSAILVLGSWAKRTAALSRLVSSADWDHLSLPLPSQNKNWSYPQFCGGVCFRHGICSLTRLPLLKYLRLCLLSVVSGALHLPSCCQFVLVGGYFILWLCLQGMGHEGKETVVKQTDDKFYLWPFDFNASTTTDSRKGRVED